MIGFLRNKYKYDINQLPKRLKLVYQNINLINIQNQFFQLRNFEADEWSQRFGELNVRIESEMGSKKPM